MLVNPKHRLSINLRSLLQSLFHWRWKWERHFNITADVIPTDPNNTAVTDNHGNPQFTTCLSYSDLFAREIIYYQAILVFLLRLGKLLLSYNLLDDVDKAAPPSLAQPLRPSPLLLPSDVHSLEDASSEFYRSMEGHLCGGRDKAAVEFYQLMFALSLVTLGVENDSIEAIWTKRIRGRMIGASGFDMWAACRERSIGSIADSKP